MRETTGNGERAYSNSAKTINKKRVYEKEFHEILNTIENDRT